MSKDTDAKPTRFRCSYCLSGDLLLRVGLPDDSGFKEFGYRGLGLDSETGKEKFNVVLPQGVWNPEIVELGELFLIWSPIGTLGGGRSSALIDRTGKVRMELPQGCVDVIETGKEWVCLAGKDLVRVTMEGKTIWTQPFVKENNYVGQIVSLKTGNLLACAYDPTRDSGVHVIRFDPKTGLKRWQTHCEGLGISPTGPLRLKNQVRIGVVDDQVRVTTNATWGAYNLFTEEVVECLALDSGQRISRRVARLEAIRGLTIDEAVKKLEMNPKECRIFDEPPGLARGVRGRMLDDRSVTLWISRQDGVFRENRDWTFEQISGLKVVRAEEQ